jgi:hypothetical protein
VERLEDRSVPSAIGFHGDISLHLATAHNATKPPSITQDGASAIQSKPYVKSIPVTEGRVPAALARGAHGLSELLRSGAPIPLDSELGLRMLEESDAKRNYTALVINFTTQINETYCGVATTAVVFNASGIPRPVSTADPKFHYFDQVNLITDRVKKVININEVLASGMTLDTYGRFLSCFPVQAKVTHAGDTTRSAFLQTAIRTLKSHHDFLVVNYFRPDVGQVGGGHYSPVAAYDAATDRFLILDVARYRYPPVWVPATRLWNAMEAVDSDSGRSRGFVVIKT